MKPYPLASLNHFTFPLAIARCLQRSESNLRFGCWARQSTCGAYIGTPCTFVKKCDTALPVGLGDFTPPSLAPTPGAELGSRRAERKLDWTDDRRIHLAQRGGRRRDVGSVPCRASRSRGRGGEGAPGEAPPGQDGRRTVRPRGKVRRARAAPQRRAYHRGRRGWSWAPL